nr:RNA-directed DNA polymerase, eukaryota [Tanacetum cinerariifolium]
MLDQGGFTDGILLSRMEVLKLLHDVQSSNNRDIMQKAKIRWAIEGTRTPNTFTLSLTKKRDNLFVKGVMVDGDWIDDPDLVKQDNDQILYLESSISKDEICTAVWGCGVDKSPGPDGFTFEFFLVTKILATRLSLVISDFISDVQTVFLPNRQILDGPFIINEILARCKLKKLQAMILRSILPRRMSINIQKSHLLCVGILDNCVAEAAKSIAR